MWKWASGREIGENVDCLLVFSCSTEFFNNCQQSVVLRNSLTKKLFLMFLYLKVSLKKNVHNILLPPAEAERVDKWLAAGILEEGLKLNWFFNLVKELGNVCLTFQI